MKRMLLVGAVIILGMVGAGWLVGGFTTTNKDDPSLFANRAWVDRSPKHDRDRVLYITPLKLGSRAVGLVHNSSRYAFAGEWFSWSRNGGELVLKLPQSQRTARFGLRTWKCGANEAPKGFTLCMELTQGDQKRRYYSNRGWRIPRPKDLPQSAWSMNLDSPPVIPERCENCEEVGLDALFDY